jgi:hypothetical protein
MAWTPSAAVMIKGADRTRASDCADDLQQRADEVEGRPRTARSTFNE